MLKLKELIFSGIGRFVDEQTINFESLGSLVQVDGINNNTGGSSGAGKSTVFHALDFLFGLNNIPNTILKSRLTENGLFVQGTFEFDSKKLIITRSKKLSIDIDGQVTTGSAKITEEELDKILGMPRELFRKMLHKRQKEGGFFLNFTPREINDFLTDCLNLGNIKGKIEVVEKKAKELLDSKNNIFNSLESSRSALIATQDAVLSLGISPIKDIEESAIEQLKEKLEKSIHAHKEIIAKQKLEKDALELSRPQISVTSFDRSKIEHLENEYNTLKKQIDELQYREKNRQIEASKKVFEVKTQKNKLQNQLDKGKTSTTEATRIGLEIKKIRDSLCPTCEQNWATDQAKAKENELLGKLKTLKEDILAAQIASKEIESINNILSQLELDNKPQEIQGVNDISLQIQTISSFLVQERQIERDHQSKESDKNRVILQEFANKQKHISEQHELEKNQSYGQENLDRRTLENALNKLRAYEDAKSRYETSLSSLKAKEAGYNEKIDQLNIQMTGICGRLAMAEELKRALKSYLSCSFDSALENIGDNATRLIRNIPNMASSTIQLEGIRETNAGALKEEVNAVIHMDGEHNIDIRTLSGGERTSADLAIDLAVISLIEERANKGIDLLILDEPLGGLDATNSEQVLEMLKNSNTGKRLVLVDHSPIVKEFISDKIIVERNGQLSTVK